MRLWKGSGGTALKDVTIVMLTSLDQKGDRDRCHKLGICRYLVKPVSPSTLLDAIVDVIYRSEASAPQRAPGETVGTAPLPSIPSYLRVLVAEDNLVNRKLAVRLLEKIGLKPETAENGLEVMKRTDTKDYDVVLMDIQMPEMDGIEPPKRSAGCFAPLRGDPTSLISRLPGSQTCP
jgi:CheY-like chemotaxis protein